MRLSGAHESCWWISPLRHMGWLTLLVISLYGCPEKPSGGPDLDSDPSLILSSASICTDLILPEIDISDPDVEPVFLPLEVRMTGLSGSQVSELTTKLSFIPAAPKACFLSAVTDENGEVPSLRCMSASSDDLSFSGSRAFDAFYCTSTGRFQVKATTTLNDEEGTVIESNPIEVSCLPQAVFEDNCEKVGEDPIDMALDMEVDMEVMDMGEEIVLPASWSVAFNSGDSAITNLSVQGSTSPYPKNATYEFAVIDQEGSPIANVPVKFFLDWSALDEYQICEQSCSSEQTEELCDNRATCEWVSAPTDAGAEAGAQPDEAGVEPDEAGVEPEEAGVELGEEGYCGPDSANLGIDERCTDRTERCEANLCLPPSIDSLPLAIEPSEVITGPDGIARVSVVTTSSPGVYSIKAVAAYNGNVQEARTPSLTIWHQIPSQQYISLSCQSPITATFARRSTPNTALGTDQLGYTNLQRLASECRFQTADRFSGRIANVPVFFLSEAGNIAQSVISDDMGLAVAGWNAGGRSPIDVEPQLLPMPFVDIDNDNVCTEGVDEPSIPASVDGGGCSGRIAEPSKQFNTSGQPGALPIRANPRDGLIRVVGFTQEKLALSTSVRPYKMMVMVSIRPDFDLVPSQPEPFIDAKR